MISKEEFHVACEAAYGTNYTSDVAKALDVSDRTVRAWRDGYRNIPNGVSEELSNMLDFRRETISAVFADLNIKRLKYQLFVSHIKFGVSEAKERRDLNFYEQVIIAKIPSFVHLAKSLAITDEEKNAVSFALDAMERDENISLVNRGISIDKDSVAILSKLLHKNFEPRHAIAHISDIEFSKIFPEFIFTPEEGLLIAAFLPMHDLRPYHTGYRVSKRAAKFVRRSDDYDDTRVVSVTYQNEIIFITEKEFVLNGFSETSIKPINA